MPSDSLYHAAVKQSLADLLDQAEALVTARLSAITVKSINQIVTQYSDQLTNAVYDVFNGHSDAVDMRRAHKAMLRNYAEEAYKEGLREGGIDADELDEEDQAQLDETVGDWLGGQLEHVNDFSKAIGEARKDKDLRPAIIDRIDQWVDSLRTLGDLGRAYALQNEKGQWTLGATEQHCETCLKLSGMKPHRVSWFTDRGYIPGENGSETLECGGWKCDCAIVGKKGDRLL